MSNTATRKRVLLLADTHLNLVWSLPRILHAAGAHLVLMAPEQQCFRHSRFVDEWVDAPPVAAAVAAERLRAHLAEHRYDLVVHANPNVVEALLAGSQPPASMEWLRADVARALATKTAFHPWAIGHALPVPPGRVCTSPDEACAWVAEHGPSVIKCDGTYGGTGVMLVKNPDEVRALWSQLNQRVVVVQNFIRGPVGCTELILQHGRVAGWFASLAARTVTPFGASIMRKLVQPPGMAELVQKISAATGFHGLCGFDWILDEATGRVVVLEFHPRATSGFCWGHMAGVDVPAALRDLLSGHPTGLRAPRNAEQLARAPLGCYFPSHFWWALTVQRSDLPYWLPGSNAASWRNVPFDDPRLLASVCAFALRNLRRRHLPRFLV